MKNLRAIILSAMVAGVLIVPGTSATADAKDGKEYSHFRKNDQHGKWKGDHGRRDGYHGRGRDHQRWPNAYFAEQGLYSLVMARASVSQPP